MKRCLYDEWRKEEENARDPNTWLIAPRRKCSTNKNFSETFLIKQQLKQGKTHKDNIETDTTKAVKRKKTANKEKTIDEEQESHHCKRKLRFSNKNELLLSPKIEIDAKPVAASNGESVLISVEIVEGHSGEIHVICEEEGEPMNSLEHTPNWNTELSEDSSEDSVIAKDTHNENTPDTHNENTPDTHNENTPDTHNENTPDTHNENTPDTHNENTPDTHNENTPDTHNENTPDTHNENTPDTHNENTPDRVKSEEAEHIPSTNMLNKMKAKKPETAESPNVDGKEANSNMDRFQVGDLIFGKLKGFDWWPGQVITNLQARQRPAIDNCQWIKWFGDNKVSEILTSSLESFSQFVTRYTPHRMRGVYKRGIKDVLEMAAHRCKKIGLPIGGTKEAEDRRVDSLIQWAIDGFQPSGPQGLTPPEKDGSESCSDDEDTEAQDPIIRDQPTKFYRDRDLDHKDRVLGRPIQRPLLAENVKALFDRVAEGEKSIEGLCLGCGDTNIAVEHPLFEGGLCKECKASFIEGTYLFDEDGSQMYCSICSDGREVLLCDSPGCCRSYCTICVDLLCGVGTSEKIATEDKWECFMCTNEKVNILKSRTDWQERLKELFAKDDERADYPPQKCFPPVPISERKPIRVLALFDGIASGLQALKQLDIEVEVYLASEIDDQALKVAKVQHGDAVKHIGNVELITEKMVEEWGPFDLIVGGSPCNDLSIANPARKGIYEGSGRLFFDFFRILMYARPPPNSERPFFWLFENVVGMRHQDKRVISRFLQCNPSMVDAKEISAQHRARYFWGNLPGMNRSVIPLPVDKLCLQDCLEPNCGRKARFEKIRCITTKANSLKQTKHAVMPVETQEEKDIGDVLWCTEIERLFGFPEHYTDVANMGKTQRQKLLGSAWCIPVIRHLLAPLRDYFKTSLSPNK